MVATLRTPKPVSWSRLRLNLSPRTLQTLQFLLQGLSEKEIALRLSISRHTVHVYVKQLYDRFQVNSRSELLSLWIDWAGGSSPVRDANVAKSRSDPALNEEIARQTLAKLEKQRQKAMALLVKLDQRVSGLSEDLRQIYELKHRRVAR